MGDGREGDCPIYLKKSKRCTFHNPKYVSLSKSEIQDKVTKIVCDRAYVQSCLDVEVCPECGHNLTIIYDDLHGLDDGKCIICQKTWPLNY